MENKTRYDLLGGDTLGIAQEIEVWRNEQMS